MLAKFLFLLGIHYLFPLQPSAKPVVRSFRDVFLDFRYDAVPLCSGCHLFLSYLDQQYVLLLFYFMIACLHPDLIALCPFKFIED